MDAVKKHRRSPERGLGVDAEGGPVIDPTENVKALSEASTTRQDDLRAAQNTLVNEQIRAIKEVVDIRARHTSEITQLRADHAKEIRGLESDRLDKIRQVDVLAGNTAADRALVAIQTLATVTAGNAETLRAMVASTATSIASQTDQRMAAVNERIAALEKSAYTGQGKQAYSDPMLAELAIEIKGLRDSRSVGTGKGEGLSTSWMILLGAVGLIGTLITIATVVFALMRK
jgi:hypothetical protein